MNMEWMSFGYCSQTAWSEKKSQFSKNRSLLLREILECCWSEKRAKGHCQQCPPCNRSLTRNWSLAVLQSSRIFSCGENWNWFKFALAGYGMCSIIMSATSAEYFDYYLITKNIVLSLSNFEINNSSYLIMFRSKNSCFKWKWPTFFVQNDLIHRYAETLSEDTPKAEIYISVGRFCTKDSYFAVFSR